jgi:hypothetical protein
MGSGQDIEGFRASGVPPEELRGSGLQEYLQKN